MTRQISSPVSSPESAHLDIIYEYLRNIGLANSYREKAERLQLGQDKNAAKTWLENIIETWRDNLKQCETSINRVIALAGNHTYRTAQPGAAADAPQAARRLGRRASRR
jgi:hypothetical protein